MRSVTIDQVMEWGPCEAYSRERLVELAAGRDRLTAADIADLHIPVEDRLWAVLHEELIPNAQLRLLACQFAETALIAARDRGRNPDPRSWAAIEVGRRHALGVATNEELAAAWAAARAAARDAAWDAAGCAQLKITVDAASEENDEPKR